MVAFLLTSTGVARVASRRVTKGFAANTIKLNFKLPNFKLNYGNMVAVVGSSESLGGWDSHRSLQLVWNEGDCWTGSAQVPIGEAFEYKYVIHGEGVLEWQPCDNLVLAVQDIGAAAVTVTDSWWGGAREVTTEPRPAATRAELLLAVPLAEEATDVATPFAATVPMPVLAALEVVVEAVPEETEAVVAQLVAEASALAAAMAEAPPTAAEPAQPAPKLVAAGAAAEVANVMPAPAAAKLPKDEKAAPKPSSTAAAPKRSVARRPAPSAAAKAGPAAATPAAPSCDFPVLLPRPLMTPAASPGAASLPSSRAMAGSAVTAASFTAAPEDMSLVALKAALKELSLPTSGRKAELAQRLRMATSSLD